MPRDGRWYAGYGEEMPEGRWRCRECGMEMAGQGGRFVYHLQNSHGLTEEAGEQGVPFPEAEALREAGKLPTLRESVERYQRLADDPRLHPQTRLAAEDRLAKMAGHLDQVPEASLEEKERVWMEMHVKAMKCIDDAISFFRKELRSAQCRGELRSLMEEGEAGEL